MRKDCVSSVMRSSVQDTTARAGYYRLSADEFELWEVLSDCEEEESECHGEVTTIILNALEGNLGNDTIHMRST